MKFGENIKKLRKSKKISQEDLAEKMQVSRQSVSKWETGDAYPEMNNILELCKIFHCHINDLINDSIIDMDSLDEEIKMNVVKFKSEQQRKMKILSKTIAIIAKIGRVLTLIAIPIIIISMILSGIFINKIEFDDNHIKYSGKESLDIIKDGNHISLKYNDEVIAEITDQNEILIINEVLANNSKFLIILYIESGFTILVICLVLSNIMLKSLEKLFTNINQGDTPFTLENVSYIKKIAYLMIAISILPVICGVIFVPLLKTDLNIEFDLFSLVEILFLFSIAFIFQYGYEIQLDSKGKMYGEENE